jgi:hypothetical protein
MDVEPIMRTIQPITIKAPYTKRLERLFTLYDIVQTPKVVPVPRSIDLFRPKSLTINPSILVPDDRLVMTANIV